MEDSSENLDDGELWLPSDIFPVEEAVSVSVPSNKFKNNNSPITSSFCCCYSCILRHGNDRRSFLMAEQQEAAAVDESIIQRFAAISLLQHHSVPKPFPVTERFRPAERCRCTDCSFSECFEPNGGGGRELLRTGPPPVYPYQLYPPPVQLQDQIESLIETRARVLQMQEMNRFNRMHNLCRTLAGLDQFAGNRFLPFVGVGGCGGFNGESSSVRDYGGTGVFLPRVPNNIDNNGRKKQGGGKSRQDVQQNGQRNGKA
ncbi:hypothetical protein HAX54_019671 [Datura stramonium]|uniref:Uncharacterized protein n=1 Tax=Datura stramonium TaxID=4076 RepID=A0ABS8S1X4_DATST|nr:hypothetical protein [Datura stramonium]